MVRGRSANGEIPECYRVLLYDGNPISLIDPNGKETYVIKNKTGTYTVVGGILNNNRGIYIASKDKSGKYTIKGEMIGISTSTTTFYNTDAN